MEPKKERKEKLGEAGKRQSPWHLLPDRGARGKVYQVLGEVRVAVPFFERKALVTVPAQLLDVSLQTFHAIGSDDTAINAKHVQWRVV